jgi:hypothetical protein
MLGVLALTASTARADWTVYSSFAAYNAAVGGNHTLFLNFDQDKNGNSLLGQSGTINGNMFSNEVTYSTPSAASALVNYADIGQGINVEIGPVGSWTGTLRAASTQSYYATGFTVIEGETTTAVSFYNGATLLNTLNLTTTGLFQFFGVVTDQFFDRYEVSGNFYAIDANYFSAVPVPSGVVLAGLGAVGIAAVRFRRRKVMA